VNETRDNRLNEKLNRLTPQQRALLALRFSQAKRPGSGQQSAPLPPVQPDPLNRFKEFTLSDIQQAYLVGRSEGVELGNITCHNYFEVDVVGWDAERFEAALNQVIDRHDMLRCIVLPEGKQRILEQVPPYQVKSFDLRGLEPAAASSQLQDLRERMSHMMHPSDQWPLFDFVVSHLDAHRTRLHISIDMLIADGRSFEILFSELAHLYFNPNATLPPLDLTFRDYLHAFNALENTDAFRASREYWLKRLPTLPASPELPLLVNPAAVKRPRYIRRSARIDTTTWKSLKEKGSRISLTPSGVLLAAFAEVLAIWSKNPRFTINLTLFNRPPLHEQSNDIIGDFTSVSLLEVDNEKPEVFESRAKRMKEQLWQDLDHRDFSGVRVLRELSALQGTGPKAIMPVVFTSLLNLADQSEEKTWAGRLGKLVFAISQTPQVYLDFMVNEDRNELVISWDTVEELFPAGMLDDMFEAFQRLLRNLASTESSWQRTLAENTLELIPAWQMEIRQQVNATESPVTDGLLHTLFLKQVGANPQQIAIRSPQKQLTYEEVYRRACRIEEELLRRNIQPNHMVAVLMEKGWEQAVAVLGIHFAGGAYLPIDSELPAERQRFLIADANVKVVLTQSAVRDHASVPEGVDVLIVDQLEPGPSSALVPRRRQKPEDLAYIIYTSGSTGNPKGVMIDHRGAVNTILDLNQRFGIGPQDRVLALSKLSFDLSVSDIFGLLAAGGTIVFPEASLALDASHWAQLVRSEKITVWNTVPALMQLLVEQAQKGESIGDSLRVIMLSGDWIPVNLPSQIRKLLPQAKIMSLGGATEASIWSILYPVEHIDPSWKSVPYGKPMLNQTFHVLNAAKAPCPVWVPGQLHIGGIGLAKGYWQDERKTNASFGLNPLTRERQYRTGDLGRYLPDGNIEFLGREDFQVKVQGYRIELGEIEARLQACPGVENCVVAVREDDPGEKRLVGYVILQPGKTLDSAAMREHLRSKLPEYMVPSAIVSLNEFPLTINGKVNRKALPAPTRVSPEAVSDSDAPRDSLELQLTQLWEKILNVRPIGLRHNFFDLGGNSLGAVRLFSEMRKLFGRAFPLSVLFQAPTIEKLADLIRKDGWAPHWTSLVPIQPGGSKPPFFCVHGGGGNVLIYRDLARYLGTDYPFYGLQARGLDGTSEYLTTTEAMAECYLREILELQPEGPYYLGGFCMGGQVAVEIAQRLVRAGQKVNLLFVIDAHNFNGIPPQFTLKEKMQNLGNKVKFHSMNIWQLDVKSQVSYLAEKTKIALRRETERLRVKLVHVLKLNPHRDVVRGTREEYIEDINDRAFLAYVPESYPGKMTICKPRRNYSFLRDPFNGWSEIALGGLEVIELPSNPGGIFLEPYVQTLAEKLKEQIDHAAASGSEVSNPLEPVLR
jgi:amino acid adenylation domain-containing protein